MVDSSYENWVENYEIYTKDIKRIAIINDIDIVNNAIKLVKADINDVNIKENYIDVVIAFKEELLILNYWAFAVENKKLTPNAFQAENPLRHGGISYDCPNDLIKILFITDHKGDTLQTIHLYNNEIVIPISTSAQEIASKDFEEKLKSTQQDIILHYICNSMDTYPISFRLLLTYKLAALMAMIEKRDPNLYLFYENKIKDLLATVKTDFEPYKSFIGTKTNSLIMVINEQ